MEATRNLYVTAGLDSPIQRAVITGSLITVLVLYLKPFGMYDGAGNALPLGDGSSGTTVSPWWLPGLTGAIVAGVFI